MEGKLAIDTVMAAAKEGKLEEVFGSGTAAVVSPVKQLDYEDQSAFINNGEIGPLTQKLYDTMTGMQWGKLPDTKGWILPVCRAEIKQRTRAGPRWGRPCFPTQCRALFCAIKIRVTAETNELPTAIAPAEATVSSPNRANIAMSPFTSASMV